MVHSIERDGDTIRVEASDNVRVAKVNVEILDEKGEVSEEGEAFQADPESRPECWQYVSHTGRGAIMADAWDLAGNRTRSTL